MKNIFLVIVILIESHISFGNTLNSIQNIKNLILLQEFQLQKQIEISKVHCEELNITLPKLDLNLQGSESEMQKKIEKAVAIQQILIFKLQKQVEQCF